MDTPNTYSDMTQIIILKMNKINVIIVSVSISGQHRYNHVFLSVMLYRKLLIFFPSLPAKSMMVLVGV